MRLTEEQRAASSLRGGPVRVVAGAGTGKTAVIAERFRRLVATGVSPESILVMTFTERAAAEMRERIEQLIEVDAPQVGTFHSMCMAWLRADGAAVRVNPRFGIVMGADRWILMRELMWELGDNVLTGEERPDDLVGSILQMLERLKQELVPVTRLAAWAAHTDDDRAPLMRACVRLFAAYERECRRLRLLDFEDLLVNSVKLFSGHADILSRYRARFPHVLVDEYQDLNLAQERLVELLAQTAAPFVVGDDDQSIYRFRGASRASLERFLLAFPAARTVTLGTNRRSSKNIVDAANALITRNDERLPKSIRASGTLGAKVQSWAAPDGVAEARAIALRAFELHEAGMPLASIAVLCRTNAIVRPIATALGEVGLPYLVIGGHGFLDRPEIRDVIALLRVLGDPQNLIALARTFTRPPAHLDAAKVLGCLRDRATQTPLEALAGWKPARPLAQLLSDLALAAETVDVRDLFFELMERTGYLEVATAGREPSDAARIAANVGRFAEVIADFCDSNPDHSLAAYLRRLDLVLLSGEDEEPAQMDAVGPAIRLMTIHQAKGLEFEVVFVPGLVEGRLPQTGRSPRFELPQAVLESLIRGKEDVVAEERRLLYVAMTRARRLLHLTRAAHYEGGRRWRESRFLEEMKDFLETVELPVAPPAVRPPGKAPDTTTPPIALSFSSILAYRDCPRQYWYRHVARLPALQSAEAAQGEILHDALRRAGELRQLASTVELADIRRVHEQAWMARPFPDARRAATFRRNGLQQLEDYVSAGGFRSRPAHLEHAFSAPLDGWTLRGVVDRIDPLPDGEGWVITDYKSGRPISQSRRDLQLALYALGAGRSLGLESTILQVTYLASGETIQIDNTTAIIGEAKRLGRETAEAVAAGRFDAKPERRRCRLCAYRLACAEAL